VTSRATPINMGGPSGRSGDGTVSAEVSTHSRRPSRWYRASRCLPRPVSWISASAVVSRAWPEASVPGSGHHGCGKRVGQTLGPVAEDRGERVVDLHDLPGGVHDEEPVLQGGDQAAPPARLLAAQRGQRERRPDAGEQVGGGERLDQVVVGARGQPLGRGLLTGAGREDDHREGGQRRVRRAGP
jgi:hypothetical protein